MKSDLFDKLKAKFKRKENPKPPVVEFADDILPADVIWHGVNAGAWKKVSGLNITTDAEYIYYQQPATAMWPRVITGYTIDPKTGEKVPVELVGNAWVFVQFEGQWHAATNEFFRPGQQKKGKASVTSENDHIHAAPFRGWTPKAGDKIGFMGSTFARGGWDNGRERTKITLYTWR